MTQVFIPKAKQRKSMVRRWRSLRFLLSSPSIIHNFQGHPIFIDPKDRRARKIFIRKDITERPDLATWLKLFELGDWTDVVDVGANYGEFLVSIEHPENYALTAFEPNPKIFESLSKTCKANSLVVNLENAAVSNTNGSAQLHISSRQSGNSSIIENHTISTCSVMVPRVALGNYFAEKYQGQFSDRRFLIKIDIEGHDLAAIQGLGDIALKTGDFAVLFEINCVKAHELSGLLDHFDIFVLGQAGNWVSVKPPITTDSISALRNVLGFDDAVLVRNTSDSEVRSALMSLTEEQPTV